MYQLLFLEPAKRTLKRLDKSASVRILRKLYWLAENADSVRVEGLRGSLSPYAKLREGDYRVVYEINEDNKAIIVHSIGHRSEIYKD